MKNKQLIYTTFKGRGDYPEYNDLIWEWLISLRTLGKYQGDIIVFDYGGGGSLLEKFGESTKFGNISFIPLPVRPSSEISNWRNLDVIPLLKNHTDYSIAHFDADVWFQEDVGPMFEDIEDLEGAYLGVEPRRSCNFRNGPPELLEEYESNCKKIGGFIFGGFFAGKQKPFLERLERIKKIYEEKKWDIHTWGTDQSIFQILLDFSKDRVDGNKWAASHYLCEFKDGKWYLGEEPVKGLHLVAFGRNRADSLERMDKNYRFKHLHKDIYESWKSPQ
jgi:hypothetical protein